MRSAFPTADRARIEAQFGCEFPLGEPSYLARSDESLGEGTRGIRGIVAQELDDGRNPSNCGLGFVAFPIANRQLMDSDLCCNLGLEQAKVDSAGAEMIA